MRDVAGCESTIAQPGGFQKNGAGYPVIDRVDRGIKGPGTAS